MWKVILVVVMLSGCLVQVPNAEPAVASTYNQQVLSFWLQVITAFITAVIGPLVIWRVNKKAVEHKEEIVTEAKAAYVEANSANLKIENVDKHLIRQEEDRLAAGTSRRRTDPKIT